MQSTSVEPSLQRAARLLVSVRNLEEAKAAFDGGVDLIDLKEPLRGPLGAVTVEVASNICDWFQSLPDSRGVKLSLAMGELRDGEAFPLDLLSQFDFAKVGLAGLTSGFEQRVDAELIWNDWQCGLPARVQPVLVIYADWQSANSPPPNEVLQFATLRSVAAGGVLIDTWDKATDLFQSIDCRILTEVVRTVRESNNWLALAGSLNAQTVAQAMLMCPDIIAVRGAVCDGLRTDSVSKSLVAAFVNRIGSLAEMSGAAKI